MTERLAALAGDPDIDGVLNAQATQASAVSGAGDGMVAEPRVLAWQMDFDKAARFGAAGGDSGLGGPNPKPGQVVVNEPLARSLSVKAGIRSRCTCSEFRGRTGSSVWCRKRAWRV